MLQMGVRYPCPDETMPSAAVFPWISNVASSKSAGICWCSSEEPSASLCAAVRGCELPAELLLFAAVLVKKFTMPAKNRGGGGKEKGNRENEKQNMKLMKVGEYFWCYNVARIGFFSSCCALLKASLVSSSRCECNSCTTVRGTREAMRNP